MPLLNDISRIGNNSKELYSSGRRRGAVLVTDEHGRNEREKIAGIDRRDAFLLQMYTQLWNNINRHLTIIWQSVGVLAGSIAALALVQKNVLPLDYATSLVVIISAWLVAHSYDASNWFNRNQAIIVNIERQFLRQSDLHEIHPYFTGPRPAGNMLRHVKIQQLLGVGIALLMLLYHFMSQLLPSIERGLAGLTLRQALLFLPTRVLHPNALSKALPYAVAVVSSFIVRNFRNRAIKEEEALSQQAPGKFELS